MTLKQVKLGIAGWYKPSAVPLMSPRLVRVAKCRQHVVTVATAYDPDTGLMRRFTQHGNLLLGHRGDPSPS